MSDIKRGSEVQKILIPKILIENIKNKGIVNNLAEVESLRVHSPQLCFRSIKYNKMV